MVVGCRQAWELSNVVQILSDAGVVGLEGRMPRLACLQMPAEVVDREEKQPVTAAGGAGVACSSNRISSGSSDIAGAS